MKRRTLTIIGVLVLAVMVGTAMALVAPRNQTWRAAVKTFTVNLGAVDADADYIIFVAPYAGRITKVWLSSITGLTAADTVTNFRDYSVISRGTAGTGADTICTYTTLHVTSGAKPLALIPCTIGTISTTKNYMSAGEMVVLSTLETATCTSLGNCSITVEFTPQDVNAPSGTPSTGRDE